MGSALTHHAKGSKKGRKYGRAYRWDGKVHAISKYRLRHGIDANKKRGDK